MAVDTVCKVPYEGDVFNLTVSGADPTFNVNGFAVHNCQKAKAAGHRILAHGGVLPIHWDRKGGYAELPPDSYPFTANGCKTGSDISRVNIARALEITGWMSQEELEWLATEASRVSVTRIAEIGCWMGRSTRAFADNIGPGGVVYVIDTWQGSPECGELSKLPEDWIYDQFRVNVQDLGDKVIVWQMPSIQAAKGSATQFDLVFIDADHTYESVKADILAWLPLVKPGGIICGHDYCLTWPGVVQAVDELVPGAKRGAGSIWYDVVAG